MIGLSFFTLVRFDFMVHVLARITIRYSFSRVGILLHASLTECDIIIGGLVEPHKICPGLWLNGMVFVR